ncbi:MAG TPA: sulfatase [Armatimonadota bacterium]|nr:sulfatase [Armatimonadota bacterium]
MNFILICCDSLRQDHLGVYDGLAKTPNLDRFAEECAVFTRLRSEALPTVPCRRSLQTGIRVFPWEQGRVRPKGIYNRHSGWLPLRESDVTIAEHLLERDYVTGMVIDVYHLMKPAMNFHRGMRSFNFIRGQEFDQWKSAPLPDGALDRYIPADCPERRLRVFTQFMQNQQGEIERGEEGYQVARVMSEAIRWLEGNAGHGDFYLWVDSFDPHEPWLYPHEYCETYDPGYQGKEWIYPNILPYAQMTEAEINHAKALYKGHVSFVDRWVGKLLDTIDRLGLKEDTMIVFISDHGKTIGDRNNFGMSNKDSSRFLYDTPCLVYHPEGIGRGQRFDQWIYTIDLPATALNFLGEEQIPGIEGRSILPIMRGEQEKLRDYAICGYSEVACVWKDDFVLVRDDELGTEGLFNAWEDKEQQHDLAGDLPELRQELAGYLDELLAEGPRPGSDDAGQRATPSPL